MKEMNIKIALVPGDGIGPEVVGQAVKAVDAVAAEFGHTIEYRKALVGACAIDECGDPYPEESHSICMASDAVLFGAVGDPNTTMTLPPRYVRSRVSSQSARNSGFTPTSARSRHSSPSPTSRR